MQVSIPACNLIKIPLSANHIQFNIKGGKIRLHLAIFIKVGVIWCVEDILLLFFWYLVLLAESYKLLQLVIAIQSINQSNYADYIHLLAGKLVLKNNSGFFDKTKSANTDYSPQVHCSDLPLAEYEWPPDQSTILVAM